MTISRSQRVSHAQEALWFLYKLAPGSAAYNTGVALAVRSAVDVVALRRAVELLADRHDMLRSTFAEVDGRPVRLVDTLPHVELDIREVDDGDDDVLRVAVRETLNTPFLLCEDGAFRIVLLRRTPQDAVLLIAGHHIATDAASNWIMLRDLLRTYRGLVEDAEPELPALTGSYEDFVAKEIQLLSSPRGERLAQHWQQVCGGSIPAELPTDRPRHDGRANAGTTYHLDLAAEQVSALREAAREAGVSLFSYLLGVFQSLLHRYTRQNEFLVGCPTTARISPKVREVVGNFINTLVFRASFLPSTTFRQVAQAADGQVKAGIGAVGYPFALLTRKANLPRSSADSSLCRITFNMIGTATPDPLLRLLLDPEREDGDLAYGDLLVAPFELPQAEGQLDLSVNVRQSVDSLAIDFRYDVHLFEEATIKRLAGHLVHAIDVAVANPDLPVAKARLLGGGNIAQLLEFGAGTFEDTAGFTTNNGSGHYA